MSLKNHCFVQYVLWQIFENGSFYSEVAQWLGHSLSNLKSQGHEFDSFMVVVSIGLPFNQCINLSTDSRSLIRF